MTSEKVETMRVNAPWMASGSQQEVERPGESLFLSFRLSWVAYPRLLLTVVGRLLVFGILGMFVRQMLIFSLGKTMDWVLVVSVGLAVVSMIYDYLYLRSITLYTDIDGVWYSSGVFPWEMVSMVVKWRDLGDVLYETGFLSWMLRTYTVRVRSRFNNDEIHVKNLRYGDLAVEHIQRISAGLTRLGHIA